MGTEEEDEEGTVIVPTGTTSVFTERLLRNILDLDPGQQAAIRKRTGSIICVASSIGRNGRRMGDRYRAAQG